MDTSELSNENNPDFNVLNTTVSASAVAHALHNINMDAILFRDKTSLAPILVVETTAATSYTLTNNNLVQALVSTQPVLCSASSGATYTNGSFSFGPDTAANALALLQLFNLDEVNLSTTLTFTALFSAGSSPNIVSTPGSGATYVVSPATLFTGTVGGVSAVERRLCVSNLSTYVDNVLTVPKVLIAVVL